MPEVHKIKLTMWSLESAGVLRDGTMDLFTVFSHSGQRQYHVPDLIGLGCQEKLHIGIILGSPVYCQDV